MVADDIIGHLDILVGGADIQYAFVIAGSSHALSGDCEEDIFSEGGIGFIYGRGEDSDYTLCLYPDGVGALLVDAGAVVEVLVVFRLD